LDGTLTMGRKKTEKAPSEATPIEKPLPETMVRVHVRTADLIRDIVHHRKTTSAKYLGALLEPLLRRDLDRELKKKMEGNH
jgi:hypothetical protein